LDKEIDTIAFYKNRILRIYPLYVFWGIYYFYANNLTPINFLCSMFFLIPSSEAFSVSWSVIVELQIYAILPFIIKFTKLNGKKYLFFLLTFLVFFKLLIYMTSQSSIQTFSYWTIFGRLDEFLCGMIVTVLSDQWKFSNKLLPFSLLLSSIASLITLFYYFKLAGGYVGIQGIKPNPLIWIFRPLMQGIAYGSLVLGYIKLPININKHIDYFFGKLGEISYSIYWNHSFVIAFSYPIFLKLFKINLDSFYLVFLYSNFFVLPICLILSFVTYYLIEKPFLLRRKVYIKNLDENISPSKLANHPLNTFTENTEKRQKVQNAP